MAFGSPQPQRIGPPMRIMPLDGEVVQCGREHSARRIRVGVPRFVKGEVPSRVTRG
jgi:hypothetical protein